MRIITDICNMCLVTAEAVLPPQYVKFKRQVYGCFMTFDVTGSIGVIPTDTRWLTSSVSLYQELSLVPVCGNTINLPFCTIIHSRLQFVTIRLRHIHCISLHSLRRYIELNAYFGDFAYYQCFAHNISFDCKYLGRPQ